jgi:RNA polymerase sigma-70 factor (ECF subfamily)
MAHSRPADSSTHDGQWFSTTHWSVVLAARDIQSPRAADALEKLCRAYWRPLYTYVRRQGHGPEEAKHLTQGFFARLLEKNYLAHLRHQEGKFRSFLLTVLNHFLSDQRDKARAKKRGGGQTPIFLDALLRGGTLPGRASQRGVCGNPVRKTLGPDRSRSSFPPVA